MHLFWRFFLFTCLTVVTNQAAVQATFNRFQSTRTTPQSIPGSRWRLGVQFEPLWQHFYPPFSHKETMLYDIPCSFALCSQKPTSRQKASKQRRTKWQYSFIRRRHSVNGDLTWDQIPMSLAPKVRTTSGSPCGKWFRCFWVRPREVVAWNSLILRSLSQHGAS